MAAPTHAPAGTHAAYAAWMGATWACACLLVLALNRFVDPLWYWQGNIVTGENFAFNERQAKLNRFLREPLQYDCIIFGSSRTTLLPSLDFRAHRCFNFSFSAGQVEEFLAFAQYLRQLGVSPKLVVVGVDEFNFAAGPRRPLNVPDYVRDQLRPPLPLGAYVTVDAARMSWRTLRDDSPLWRYYDRRFEGQIRPNAPRFEPDRTLEAEGRRPAGSSSQAQPRYAPEKAEAYARFAAIFPGARIVGYVPPISAWHIERMRRGGTLDSYIDALHAAAPRFEMLLDYSIPMETTWRTDNTYDGSHYTPAVNARIARELDSPRGSKPRWGVDVTGLSRDQYAAHYRRGLEAFGTTRSAVGRGDGRPPATRAPRS